MRRAEPHVLKRRRVDRDPRRPRFGPCLGALALVAAACNPVALLPARDPERLQELILADGVVTAAEYRRAWEAARECMAERGWEVGELREDGLDGAGLNFNVTISGAGRMSDRDLAGLEARMERDRTECVEGGFVGPIQNVYAQTRIPIGEKRIRRAAELESCLADLGVDDVPYDPDDPDPNPVVAAIVAANLSDRDFSAALSCLERHEVLFPSLFSGADG